MRAGNRLFTAREDKKMTQGEMSELLGISTSAYSRLERNETSLELDQIAKFAETLQIPIQEFLPETLSIYNNNDNGHVGFVIGNVYNYNNDKEVVKELEEKIKNKDLENTFLSEKVKLLEDKINNLEQLLEVIKSNKIQ